MNDIAAKPDPQNPFAVLGLTADASEEEIRSRYLELVKRYPPDREPEKFREIHIAFETAREPLELAGLMLSSPDDQDPPSWQDAIDAHARRPPPMEVDFVLSLGNRPKSRPPGNNTASQTGDGEV